MIIIWRVTVVMLLIVFLSGCATKPPSQAKLTDLLQQNLIHLPDKNFESLPPEIKEKEIVFLGELHNVPALIEVAARLTVYLATDRPVVYAKEAVYGLHPFFEAASLGKPNAIRPVLIQGPIMEFNATQPSDRKILITALDIEHTIRINKKDTVCFLQELASRSTSTAVREALEKEIPRLIETKTFDEVDAYLLNLNRLFIPNLNTFSPEDQDEVTFSLELLEASNQIERNDDLPNVRENWKTVDKAGNLRYEYFKKTIERAYQKAQKNNSLLLCHVGNAHVSLARDCETRYFACKYPLTKGKVFAIQMIPLYDEGIKDGGYDDIDLAVKSMMKKSDYCYLPLRQLQANAKTSLKWSNYFRTGKPVCDGLLFVKVEGNKHNK